MSLVVFLLAQIFGDKAPCRTIIRNALKWEAYPGISLAFCMHIWDIILPLFTFTKHQCIIRSPIKTMQEWHLFPFPQKVVHSLTIRTLILVKEFTSVSSESEDSTVC